ncbi:MAG: TolC family protein [Bacteroidales bacterium]|jgi:outer membrane protein TolC|nr:TolC family protein [Bacteroidales bacterium]MCI2144774.1 TolC family protein [Bacteroidales bacterium]
MKKNKMMLAVLLLFPCMTVSAQNEISLSLEECKTMSKSNDPYVRNAQLDLLSARAQKREALAEYFPTVSLNAFGFQAIDPMLDIQVKDILGNSDAANNLNYYIQTLGALYGIKTSYSALSSGYTASLTLTQPLYAGGRIANGNRLASLGIEAASLRRNVKLRDNDEDVEQKYWQVVSLEDKMVALAQAVKLVDTLYKDVSSARLAGLSVESDVMQVKLKRNELLSQKIQLEGGIRLAKMDLFNAIGVQYNPYRTTACDSLPYIDDIHLSDKLSGLSAPDKYYVPEEQAARKMDENRLLELSVDAKKLEKRIALGESLPQVGLGASYGYGHLIGDPRTNGVVFATVKIPITDWAKTYNKVRRYGYEVQKAVNEKEYLDNQLILQVRQLWVNLTCAWDQLQVAKESVSVAEQTVRQLSTRYEAGLVPVSDLLEAQTELRSAQNKLTDEEIAYCLALTKYRLRTEATGPRD